MFQRLCLSDLCELLGGRGQYGHGAIELGEEFVRQVSQTGSAGPLHQHPQAGLDLQHFGALEPTSGGT